MVSSKYTNLFKSGKKNTFFHTYNPVEKKKAKNNKRHAAIIVDAFNAPKYFGNWAMFE